MKLLVTPALIALLAASFAVPVTAQTDHSKHGVASPKAAEAPLADGAVKKIDKAARKVTLSHGPLPNGMPAMTMAFRVKDPAWLDKMKEGQKIRFAADTVNGELTVVRFEPGQ